MKRVLITNASSCIGINLAHSLLTDANTFVYAFDKQLSKNTPSLFTLLKNDNYSFTEHNLISPIDCIVDEIYHLSPCLNTEEYKNNKYDYIIREYKILNNILKLSSISGAKLLFVNKFLDYSDNLTSYFSYFDAVKSMHSLINEFAIKDKIDYKIAQISDYYGINSVPSQDDFVGSFIINALYNHPITIENNQYIYLTYVNDITKSLIKIMNSYSEFNIFDVSSPNTVLKSDLLRLIIKLTKSNSPISLNEAAPMMPKYEPDISKLNSCLDVRCAKSILEGITETINFYKLMYFQ